MTDFVKQYVSDLNLFLDMTDAEKTRAVTGRNVFLGCGNQMELV